MNTMNCRKFKRVNVDFPILIQMDSGSITGLGAHAINISFGGILIWSARSLPLHVPLIINFPFKWEQAFTLAKAIRCNKNNCGCEFVDLKPKAHASLAWAMSKYLSQHNLRQREKLTEG